jgi:PAS domain S-box-containing protein/diguanylate cyclase (GGDEF)-like protein
MLSDLNPEIYRVVLETLGTGVYLVDRDRKIVFWNDGAEKITGYLRHEAVGRSCLDNLLMHCDENNALLCGVACPLAHTMQDGKPREVNAFLRHKEGERVPVHIRAVPVRDGTGAIIGAAETFDKRTFRPGVDLHPIRGVIRDSIDAIAGIPDHRSTLAHLEASLREFREDHAPIGVLSLAIDKLDQFRGLYGRRAVEMAEHAAAQTLSKSLGPDDIVGRWREGRFVAVVTSCPATVIERAGLILKRMVSLSAITWWGDRISVTVSVGGTAARAEDTADSLLGRAEEALEKSMREGGDRVAIL